MVVFAIALIAALVGALLGIQAYVGGVAIVGSLTVLAGCAWYIFLAPQRVTSDIGFWALFGIGLAVIPLSLAIGGARLNFTAEVVLFAAAPVSLVAVWKHLSWSRAERAFAALFLVYLGWQVFVTAFGRSELLAAVYQFFTNLKPFLLLALGFSLAWSTRTEAIFWFAVRWTWLYIGAFVALQIVSPSTYAGMFGQNLQIEHASNPIIPLISRMQGPFQHSSVLATFCIQFAVFCFCRVVVKREWVYLLFSIPYLLLTAFSGQRQEIFVLIIVVFLLWVAIRFRVGVVGMGLLAALASMLATLILWPVLGENFRAELALWSDSGAVGVEGVRSALYNAAARIANEYAPLGSGLGTFGGPGAVRFDQSLYLEMGLERFWWFRRGLFLQDSIWACYIAELGWSGAAVLATLFAAVIASAGRTFQMAQDPDRQLVALMALSSALYAVLVSPTAFVITDPVTGLMSFVFLGMAYRRIRSAKSPRTS